MKKFRLLTLLGIALVAGALAGCGSDNKDDFIIEDITGENEAVINYNDNLVDIASQCLTSEDAIWEAYDNVNSTTEEIMNAIDNTIAKCGETTSKINELGDREGDSSLKDGVLSIIEKEIAYYSEFKELLPFLEKGDLSDEELGYYNTIYSEVEALDKELSEANDNLLVIQEEFAEKYGFELEEATE